MVPDQGKNPGWRPTGFLGIRLFYRTIFVSKDLLMLQALARRMSYAYQCLAAVDQNLI
jgi:hypothetical protein